MMKWFLVKPRDEVTYPDLPGWLVRAETAHDARDFVPKTTARTWDILAIEKDGLKFWNPWTAEWSLLPKKLQDIIDKGPIE